MPGENAAGHTYTDPFGRVFTGHWVVQPGREVNETLVTKLGILLVSLGVIHFVNMAVFWKIRRRAVEDDILPLPHTAFVEPPPPVTTG